MWKRIWFPRDSIRFCPLRQAELSCGPSSLVYFLRASSAQSCFMEIVPRSTYLSLFNFIRRLSPAHLALHVILISSFITDVIAPLLGSASERCNALPSYAVENFVVVLRNTCMLRWSNWTTVTFPFFPTKSLA